MYQKETYSHRISGSSCASLECAQLLHACMLGHSFTSNSVADTISCSQPGFSIPEIPQAGILERVAIPFSRGSFWPRDQTQVSRIADGFFFYVIFIIIICKLFTTYLFYRSVTFTGGKKVKYRPTFLVLCFSIRAWVVSRNEDGLMIAMLVKDSQK